MFYVGHTSTSVSLATGLAKGRDVVGKDGNVIAIIGDGSLSDGEALEGLDYAGEMNTNLIIVVNDNEHPVVINVPNDGNNNAKYQIDTNYEINPKYQICESGSDVAILALGDFFEIGIKVSKHIEEKLGQKVASYLGKADVKVLNYGFENKFYDGVEASVALKERRITPEDIWEDIK